MFCLSEMAYNSLFMQNASPWIDSSDHYRISSKTAPQTNTIKGKGCEKSGISYILFSSKAKADPTRREFNYVAKINSTVVEYILTESIKTDHGFPLVILSTI